MTVLRSLRPWPLGSPTTTTTSSNPTKVVFHNFYAFLQLWNLIFVQIYLWIHQLYKHYYQYKNHDQQKSTTLNLFGQQVTLDIDPKELTSINELEQDVPQNCLHGWIRSSAKGHSCLLHYRSFVPWNISSTDKPKAIIIWMHGLQGFSGEAHSLRDGKKTNMALMAETYLQQGYALYAMDMRGHGYSEGPRWYMPNGQIMLQDYLQFIQHVACLHDDDTDVPLFLSGYCYGGCLTLQAARYFQDYPNIAPKAFRGILLQAPAIYNLECFYLFGAIAWIARTIVTPLLGSHFLPPDWIPNRVHPRRFWRDAERYRLGMIPNGMNSLGRHIPLQTCLTLVEDMIHLRNNTIPRLQVPFCVVHGGCDKIVPTSGTKYLLQASLTPRQDQALRYFPQAYHDLLGEPDCALEVVQFQVEWIQSRL